MDIYDLSDLDIFEVLGVTVTIKKNQDSMIYSRKEADVLIDSNFPYSMINQDGVTKYNATIARTTTEGHQNQVISPNVVLMAIYGLPPESTTEELRDKFLTDLFNEFRVRVSLPVSGFAFIDKDFIGTASTSYGENVLSILIMVDPLDIADEILAFQCAKTTVTGIIQQGGSATVAQVKASMIRHAEACFGVRLQQRDAGTLVAGAVGMIETMRSKQWIEEGVY